MPTVTELIRDHLLGSPVPALPSLDILRQTEWLPEFEQLMRNRLVMGAFRYGLMSSPDKTRWSCLPSIRRRLDRYEETHNLEHLVDVANLCLVEFLRGQRLGYQLSAIDDGEHVTSTT